MSQYGKFPSSHISSALLRGDAVLKGWATENVATEGAPFILTSLSAISGGRDHTGLSSTAGQKRASSTNAGNNDVAWMLLCRTVTLVLPDIPL